MERSKVIYILAIVSMPLLFLNLTGFLNPANAQVQPKQKAAVQDNYRFLSVGKSYRCHAPGRPFAVYTISEVDRSSGWFEASMKLRLEDYGNMPGYLTRSRQWFNVNRFDGCYELDLKEMEKLKREEEEESEKLKQKVEMLLRDNKDKP